RRRRWQFIPQELPLSGTLGAPVLFWRFQSVDRRAPELGNNFAGAGADAVFSPAPADECQPRGVWNEYGAPLGRNGPLAAGYGCHDWAGGGWHIPTRGG